MNNKQQQWLMFALAGAAVYWYVKNRKINPLCIGWECLAKK